MDLQIAIVAVLIAAAALYIGWQVWRTWAGAKNGGCGGGCGCAKPAMPTMNDPQQRARIPLNQISQAQ